MPAQTKKQKVLHILFQRNLSEITVQVLKTIQQLNTILTAYCCRTRVCPSEEVISQILKQVSQDIHEGLTLFKTKQYPFHYLVKDERPYFMILIRFSLHTEF